MVSRVEMIRRVKDYLYFREKRNYYGICDTCFLMSLKFILKELEDEKIK